MLHGIEEQYGQRTEQLTTTGQTTLLVDEDDSDVVASAFPLGLRHRRPISTSNIEEEEQQQQIEATTSEEPRQEQQQQQQQPIQDAADNVDAIEEVQRLRDEMRRMLHTPAETGINPNRRVMFTNNNRAGTINRRTIVNTNRRNNHRQFNNNNNNNNNNLFWMNSQQVIYWKLPGLYSLISTILAAIAVLTTSQQQHQQSTGLFTGFLWMPSTNSVVQPSSVAGAVSSISGKQVATSDSNSNSHHNTQTLSVASIVEQQQHQHLDVGLNVKGVSEEAKQMSNPSSSIDEGAAVEYGFLSHRLFDMLSQLESVFYGISTSPDAATGISSSNNNDNNNNKNNNNHIIPKVNDGNNVVSNNNHQQHHKIDLSFLLFWMKRDDKHEQANLERLKQELEQKQQSRWWYYHVPPSFSAWWRNYISRFTAMLDPSLISPSETTFTDLVDKILTSTPRLLAIANLFLALTFLLHQAVAEWFLGTPATSSPLAVGARRRNNSLTNIRQQQQQQQQPFGPNDWTTITGNNNNNSNQFSSIPGNVSGRERLGGFLVFKLLLISAVVAPDTLDLLILLSWYTLLSFLRSLVALCAQSTARTAASLNTGSGSSTNSTIEANANRQQQQQQQQPGATNQNQNINHQAKQPHAGVLHLLMTVLLWDFMAAAVCVGLFHGAGIGMVLLLTSDCAVLAFDIVCHILQHWLAVLESQHVGAIRLLEDDQLQHIQQQQQHTEHRQQHQHSESDLTNPEDEGYAEYLDLSEFDASDSDFFVNNNDVIRQIDRQMEALEQQHVRRSSVLESAIFTIQLWTQFLTILHFCHIWSLHGLQLSLIDGVLALQLHSAISSASQKIAERRNMHRMDTAMNSQFENASVLDLHKAAAAGDVCCICLGTMSVITNTNSMGHMNLTSSASLFGASARSLSLSSLAGGLRNPKRVTSCTTGSCSHVKKLSCGHLYHTSCLREVVERARSMEAARCPLCRAPLVAGADGRQHSSHGNLRNNNINNENTDNGTQRRDEARAMLDNIVMDNNDDINGIAGTGGGEQQQDALFRFSTEGMFPTWLPLPAFSFEVVRRLPPQQQQPPPLAARASMQQLQQQQHLPGTVGDDVNSRNNRANNVNNDAIREQEEGRHGRESFIHRLLVAVGLAVHTLTPEEERIALEQLTDMFPQYDRVDLLRCLRQRGSAQAVVEIILLGLFPGLPRGGAFRSVDGGVNIMNNDVNNNTRNDNIPVEGDI